MEAPFHLLPLLFFRSCGRKQLPPFVVYMFIRKAPTYHSAHVLMQSSSYANSIQHNIRAHCCSLAQCITVAFVYFFHPLSCTYCVCRIGYAEPARGEGCTNTTAEEKSSLHFAFIHSLKYKYRNKDAGSGLIMKLLRGQEERRSVPVSSIPLHLQKSSLSN